jgi:hypothetical protein
MRSTIWLALLAFGPAAVMASDNTVTLPIAPRN